MRNVGRRLGAIALLALLVRAVVPAGYMLASAETAEGRYLVVQLCDSHSGFTKVIDLDTGLQVDAAHLPASTGDKPAHEKSGKAPCVFAAAPHIATPQHAIAASAFPLQVETAHYVAVSVAPGRGIAAPPPPATGPPQQI